MKITKTKRLVISRDLNILRAFVDGLKVVDEDLFLSVAYRKGRAFCRYSPEMKLKYRIEEEALRPKGFGDFRSFTADRHGNMILIGLLPPDLITLFEIDNGGKISRTTFIPGFPLLESADVDSDGFLYFHSPMKEYPVYRFSSDLKPMGNIGEFPPGNDDVIRRIAKISTNGGNNLTVVFENNPAYICRYDQEGKRIFYKKLKSSSQSIDYITQALDFTLNPQNGFLCVLKETGSKKHKLVEIFDKTGSKVDSFQLPHHTRRIHIADGNILYTSGTVFGLHGMILSGGIYGAITTIDVYKIDWN